MPWSLTVDTCRSVGLGRTQLFHPWAHEPEGGWSGACVSVSHVVAHRQGSGFDGLGWVTLGPVRARQGPVWVRISVVHQYGTVERSVRAHWGLSGHMGFRRVSIGNLIWHDRTRRGSTDRSTVPYWCTIDVRTHTGALRRPHQGGPSGPNRSPAAPSDPASFFSTADICPVSAADICLISTADICHVSTEDVCPVSAADICNI